MSKAEIKRSRASASSGDDASPAPGEKKKIRKPNRKPRIPWTDEEHAKFVHGLELFGRDWKQIAEYLGGHRTSVLVSSHAQKYFLRLYREQRPLPSKVRESGEGYTLSGKELDLNSGAAKKYLFSAPKRPRRTRAARGEATTLPSPGTPVPAPAGPPAPAPGAPLGPLPLFPMPNAPGAPAAVPLPQLPAGAAPPLPMSVNVPGAPGAQGMLLPTRAPDGRLVLVTVPMVQVQQLLAQQVLQQIQQQGGKAPEGLLAAAAGVGVRVGAGVGAGVPTPGDAPEDQAAQQGARAPTAVPGNTFPWGAPPSLPLAAVTPVAPGTIPAPPLAISPPSVPAYGVTPILPCDAKPAPGGGSENTVKLNANAKAETPTVLVAPSTPPRPPPPPPPPLLPSSPSPGRVLPALPPSPRLDDIPSPKIPQVSASPAATPNASPAATPTSHREAATTPQPMRPLLPLQTTSPTPPRTMSPGLSPSLAPDADTDAGTPSGASSAPSSKGPSPVSPFSAFVSCSPSPSRDGTPASSSHSHDALQTPAHGASPSISPARTPPVFFPGVIFPFASPTVLPGPGIPVPVPGVGPPEAVAPSPNDVPAPAAPRAMPTPDTSQQPAEPRRRARLGPPSPPSPLQRRVLPRRAARRATESGHDPHSFVQLGRYRTPFEVRVHPRVLLLADLHAHLSSDEVIGFLGGRWNPETHVLEILKARPVRPELRTTNGTDVEMDPADQLAASKELTREGLTVVGWYHSHPLFPPIPSVRDVSSHINLADLFSDHPFVGAIIGTYDAQLPSPQSEILWFAARPDRSPGTLSVTAMDPLDLVPAGTPPEDVHYYSFSPSDWDTLTSLARHYIEARPECVRFESPWSYIGGTLTHAAKLRCSLVAHFARCCEATTARAVRQHLGESEQAPAAGAVPSHFLGTFSPEALHQALQSDPKLGGFGALIKHVLDALDAAIADRHRIEP